MKATRLYLNQPLSINTDCELSPEAAHHAIKVLRLTAGKPITVFNGLGSEYTAIIKSIEKKSVTIQITEKRDTNKESPLHTHLALALSKGDRFDWALQKATELGVTEITPLFTERTEVKLNNERAEKKHQHWQNTLISACEQCQRNVLPKLNQPVTLTGFLQKLPACDLHFMLHHHAEQVLDTDLQPKSICLLVGPEGGFSDNEFNQAQSVNVKALTLGPRVLRTETAPLAALSVLQSCWGDF